MAFERITDTKMKEAVGIIKAGGLVIYPTETLYGLAADPFNRIAVLKVFAAKKRAFDKPLSVAVSSLEEADMLVFVNGTARKLAGAFLPGPLTMVLKKKARLPQELTAGSEKLGISKSSCHIGMFDVSTCEDVEMHSLNKQEELSPPKKEQPFTKEILFRKMRERL